MTPKVIETEKNDPVIRRSCIKRFVLTFPPYVVISAITIGFGLPWWTMLALIAAMMYDGMITAWLTRFDQ